MSYQEFFKGKKVTILGLGLLGRALKDTIFLAECGADLIVTDLKPSSALKTSLQKLKKFKNIKYVLGKHRLQDFRGRDFILKAGGVHLDSPFIAEAVKNKIPIEMDASLFLKLAPSVTLIGITGTRGKTTTTMLIYEILRAGLPSISKEGTGGVVGVKGSPQVFLAGNIKDIATLPLLREVKKGDYIVAELDSWQLQGFHDAKLSPQVAVFTTFLDDHLIYYKGDTDRYFEDKVAIFKYQKSGDVLIAGERVAENIGKSEIPVNGDFVIAKKEDVPSGWKIPLPGEHNLENIACAIAVARHFKIPETAIKKTVERFGGVEGRLQYVRTVKGVKIYNDNNSTTPDATIAGFRAISSSAPLQRGSAESSRRRGANIILIIGGTDKGLDMSKLVAEIPKHCKAAILLKESGTEKLKRIMNHESRLNDSVGQVGIAIEEKETLKECIEEAMKMAQKGDIILFSPAFASFGKWFKNEYDRGEQFVELVESL